MSAVKKRKPKKRRAPKARRRSAAFKAIDDYAKWCKQNRADIGRMTVALTERYTRTVLGLRRRDPLAWRGITLNCVGSTCVRYRTEGGNIRKSPTHGVYPARV